MYVRASGSIARVGRYLATSRSTPPDVAERRAVVELDLAAGDQLDLQRRHVGRRKPILELVRELLPEAAEVKAKEAKAKEAKPTKATGVKPKKPEKAPKKAQAKKPSSKPSKATAPTTKPSTAMTLEEKRRVILSIVRSRGGVITAANVRHLFGTGTGKAASNKAGQVLSDMVKEGILDRHGRSRGTTYALAVKAKAKVKKPILRPEVVQEGVGPGRGPLSPRLEGNLEDLGKIFTGLGGPTS